MNGQVLSLGLGNKILEGVDTLVEIELSLPRVGDNKSLLVKFSLVFPEFFIFYLALLHVND